MIKQPADIYRTIGTKIRDLRISLGGNGISQQDLARAMKTTANTISRWETATYKPSISDLGKLAQFFGTPVSAFLPEFRPSAKADALLNATRGLDQKDLEEVILYAQFRKARLRRKKK